MPKTPDMKKSQNLYNPFYPLVAGSASKIPRFGSSKVEPQIYTDDLDWSIPEVTGVGIMERSNTKIIAPPHRDCSGSEVREEKANTGSEAPYSDPGEESMDRSRDQMLASLFESHGDPSTAEAVANFIGEVGVRRNAPDSSPSPRFSKESAKASQIFTSSPVGQGLDELGHLSDISRGIAKEVNVMHTRRCTKGTSTVKKHTLSSWNKVSEARISKRSRMGAARTARKVGGGRVHHVIQTEPPGDCGSGQS